ncbi:hypothetical protein F5887DRAFT_1014793 [Amanita rubescens]|nr:hypothetical protein F5887DRAFT_1014793 [Amanita rubescens]
MFVSVPYALSQRVAGSMADRHLASTLLWLSFLPKLLGKPSRDLSSSTLPRMAAPFKCFHVYPCTPFYAKLIVKFPKHVARFLQ